MSVTGQYPAEDTAFQEATWRWQRAGWLAMLGVLVAAMTGAFGDGPIASTSIGQGGVTLRFDRIERIGRDVVLELSAVGATSARVTLAGSAMRNLQIQGLLPATTPAALIADGIALDIPAAAQGSRVLLQGALKAPGLFHGMLTVDGQPGPTFTMLVLP